MQICTIKPAVHVRQISIGIPDQEVAPKSVGFFFFQLDIEFAHGRRILRDGTVIAEGRIVIIRIYTPEQSIRGLVQEI